jgi:hypothetical protein
MDSALQKVDGFSNVLTLVGGAPVSAAAIRRGKITARRAR